MKKTALMIILLLLIAACGGNGNAGSDGDTGGIEEEMLEQILEEAADQDVDVDLETGDDGEMTITFEDEGETGQVSLGGDLPDDFPFPLPDEYEVGSTFEVEQGTGTVFSASISAPGDDFDAILALYDDFLNDEGFEVTKDVLSGDTGKFAFISGDRDDARADISMSVEEMGNDDAGNLFFETLISLTWTPQG